MELTGNELLDVVTDVGASIDGDLDGIIEGVRRQMYPGGAFPQNVKEVALAVGRQSSRAGAQAAARATAILMKERTVGVETRTQTFNVLFDITTANLKANTISYTDVVLDTTYDLVTGMFVVIKTADPATAQIPVGTTFSPEIGLQSDQGLIKDLAPRELYMVDKNGTTPVDSRFTRLELDLKVVTGQNFRIASRFFTPPGFPDAVIAVANQYYVYSVTFELARAKRKIR